MYLFSKISKTKEKYCVRCAKHDTCLHLLAMISSKSVSSVALSETQITFLTIHTPSFSFIKSTSHFFFRGKFRPMGTVIIANISIRWSWRLFCLSRRKWTSDFLLDGRPTALWAVFNLVRAVVMATVNFNRLNCDFFVTFSWWQWRQ